ncbi:MAG: histidine phosphatase family protein [Porticoccaceae bacterium]|nr:MAG: histidine phosphatase family protein [Porticoccaceae bacterium]
MAAPMEPITTIDVLRHGACEGGEIYRGSIDVELSPEGWQQMNAAVDALGNWQRVMTSPLARCHQFAERYASNATLPFEVDNRFREIGFGEWEGRQVKEVWQSEPDLIRAYYDNPASATPPAGEPILDVQARIVSAWESLLGRYTGERILLVVHSGVIRLLLAHLLKMPLTSISTLDVPYACITRLKVFHHSDGNVPVLLSHNPILTNVL